MTAARNPALGVSVGIPAPWVLTLVKGKRPYRPQWQTEKPLGRAFIEGEMQSGHATGLGLRLGEVSGGLVAVDLDGPSTSDYLKVNGWDLPPTVGWTSGKTGRAQWLYQIPKSLWENLDNRKVLETGIEGEQVEIRWNHHQSVLPPSVHPETGKPYQWLTSPDVAPV
ncbi:bifunctional DNA primase/polymerase, partial [Candidatus Cyanaurora vandensis]